MRWKCTKDIDKQVILDKDKEMAQQLLDLLPDDVNVGLIQHSRAFVSGVALSPGRKQNKNKRKKVNNRQLRAQGLKKNVCIVLVIPYYHDIVPCLFLPAD